MGDPKTNRLVYSSNRTSSEMVNVEFLSNYTRDDGNSFTNGTMYSETLFFGLSLQYVVLIVMAFLFLLIAIILVIGAINSGRSCSNLRRRRSQRPRISVIDGQRPSSTNGGFNHTRRGLLARMIARIEEFDSLTPLIITPNSISEDEVPAQQRTSPRMRRTPVGKITLIPMGHNLRRSDIPTAMAADENMRPVHTMFPVPMAPIHESSYNGSSGPSLRNPFEDLDLVSIDRTSFNSSLDRRTPGDVLDTLLTCNNNNSYNNNGKSFPANFESNMFSRNLITTNKNGDGAPNGAQAPSSSTFAAVHQPAVPASSSGSSLNKIYLKAETNGSANGRNRKESPSMDSLSSNLSSPIDSLGDSGSPLDTTGSIAELSDSVYMASESDVSETKMTGKIYSTDTGITQKYNGDQDKSEPDLSTFEYDTPACKRYLLHRIEEESEDLDHSNNVSESTTNGSALHKKRHKKDTKKL